MQGILNWLYNKLRRSYISRTHITLSRDGRAQVQYSPVPPPGGTFQWGDVPPPADTDGYIRYRINGKPWSPAVHFFFEGDPRLFEAPERYTRERLDSDVKAFADTLPTQKDRGATDG